jgi:hypothetical protein
VQDLPAPVDAGALEPRRAGHLTPYERAVRRKNRRWMAGIAIPALILGVAALIFAVKAGSGAPAVHPVRVPPGYHAVSDGYFAYAAPSTWSQNNAYTDDVGDLYTSGSSGWVAEHLGARTSAPSVGEAPPSSFAVFGQSRAGPFQMGAATAISVPGAQVAYRRLFTRPGGLQAVAIDAWQAGSGAEVWLLVHADPATTATVIGTLSG